MRTAIELTIVILLPTGAGYALLGGVRALRWFSGRRSRVPAAEPIERLGASLRRLRAQLDATENQMAVPAKGLRLRAVRAAYLDALRDACQRLEVCPPSAGGVGGREALSPQADTAGGVGGREALSPQADAAAADGRLPLAEIYRAEAALRQRGLDVREPAAR